MALTGKFRTYSGSKAVSIFSVIEQMPESSRYYVLLFLIRATSSSTSSTHPVAIQKSRRPLVLAIPVPLPYYDASFMLADVDTNGGTELIDRNRLRRYPLGRAPCRRAQTGRRCNLGKGCCSQIAQSISEYPLSLCQRSPSTGPTANRLRSCPAAVLQQPLWRGEPPVMTTQGRSELSQPAGEAGALMPWAC